MRHQLDNSATLVTDLVTPTHLLGHADVASGGGKVAGS